MAGLYIHIPFCRTRCVYCGFFSSTSLDMRQRYVDALCREMELRSGDVHERIETVYLGGGTPSQLDTEQLAQIFAHINDVYDVEPLRMGTSVLPSAEVTMECNPDDVTPAFASALSYLPVNRVSMGAQTFDAQRLHFLHRRHTPGHVEEAVGLLRDAGIGNISVDLMYGFPGETLEEWHTDITRALALGVEHLSAYALTYEEGTPLYRMLKQGEVEELDEELQRRMYYDLKDRLEAAGYEHYELSNFARRSGEGRSLRSRHNSSYWNHTPYIGLGAGAHSFSGYRRQWNVADISQYVAAIEQGELPCDGETLDDDTIYNETVMTSLRTAEGIDLTTLAPQYRSYCLRQAKPYLECGWLTKEEERLRLTRQGLFVSDMVMADLILV